MPNDGRETEPAADDRRATSGATTGDPTGETAAAPDVVAEITEAAARIVNAYQANDEDAYFSAFAPDSTFVFHTDAEIHRSRDDYQRRWRELVDTGWRVESCRTLDAFVTPMGDGGLFCHVMETVAGQPGARETTLERETIAFVRAATGDLVAVHEHLSAVPAGAPVMPERPIA